MTTETFNYTNLALEWTPENKRDRQFTKLSLALFFAFMLLGYLVSLIPVPEEERKARVDVPERVAQFIVEREKPKPPPEVAKPLPKPKKLERKTVKRETPKKKEQKPLTKKEVADRKQAEKSGLLALSNELADLIDTSDIKAMVGGSLKKSNTKAAKVDRSILTAGISKGSEGVESDQYIASVNTGGQLSPRVLGKVEAGLIQSGGSDKSSSGSSSLTSRAEEDITIVFDQNKSSLYSVYNRQRRKNPGLKGKIVLEMTIAASGKVTSIRIVSSQLNDPELESKLLARIKQFDFGPSTGEPITVTYPIEFLPS